VLALYTDGLVEHRDSDLDRGIDALAAELARADGLVAGDLADAMVDALLPGGPDDDVALLLAQVHDDVGKATFAVLEIPAEERAVHDARRFVTQTLSDWQAPETVRDDVVLLVSELVTNAVLHGRPPIELRLRGNGQQLFLEVRDHATYLPRRLRPTPEDEHGRGLQLVAVLADRWGTRPIPHGKSVWCLFSLDGQV
jgi:anti-sigma regulatory factor (Ser/Thr protein kinase)